MAKRIGKAFLVGCLVGLIGQILILILTAVGVGSDMVVMAAMLIFGVIAMVMIISGLYFKISAFGGSGAAIPVCGLMFGAAMGSAAAVKSGKRSAKAFLTGFWDVFKVLGSGFALAAILGLILGGYTGTPAVSAPPAVMQLVWAAVIGGAICALTQLMTELKINFALTAILLMTVGGGIFTKLGIIDFLNTLGAGGASVTALGCGNGAYSAGAVVAAGGGVKIFILVLLLNIILVAMGALCGGAVSKKFPDFVPDGKE